MQAYIKDNSLIINSMILEDEKESLLNYINKAKEGVIPTVLYNIEGDISGIKFDVRKENT